MPNVQLKHYFSAKNIDFSLNFDEIKENDTDLFFNAIDQLTNDAQALVEADFREINALSTEAGIRALIDESVFHNDQSFSEDIANIEGLHAKVMWAFLERPNYWRGANRFLHADNVSPSFWRKRGDLPNIPPYVEDEDIALLADEIAQYFRKKEARGKNCKVEPYRRHNKEYFFAYPEDYARSGVEWVSNDLKTFSRHPAFEIIFVYCEEEGSLDIYAPKNTNAIPDLQKMFAQCILKLDTLEDGQIDKRVYELKPIIDDNFEFQIEPEMGIEQVIVTKLKLQLNKAQNNERITLEANINKNKKAVYELLKHLKLSDYTVKQVGLKVKFESLEGKRAKTRSFTISYPNSCNLGYDGKDLLIREMLIQSELEPH